MTTPTREQVLEWAREAGVDYAFGMELERLCALAYAAGAREKEEEAIRIMRGWREKDWPEGFDRRTAEILAQWLTTQLYARRPA